MELLLKSICLKNSRHSFLKSSFMSESVRRLTACAALGLLILSASPSGAFAENQPEASKNHSSPTEHVLSRDILAKILTAELALQRDNAQRAYREYFSAAENSGYGELAQRALETAEAAQMEDAAQKALTLWNKLDPNNERARFVRMQDLLKAGKFDEAFPLAKDLLSESDAPDVLLGNISQAGLELGEKTRFYETLKKLAQPYEDNSSVQLTLADAAAKAKMREVAKKHGIRAIELTPDNPHILIQGADYEFALDPKAASKRLARYLKDHPNSHQVRLSYAKSLLRTGEQAKLERELAKLDSAMKDNPRIQMILGMIAEEGNLLQKAELYYKKYLVQITKTPVPSLLPDDAYVRLGVVKLNQGHTELAIDWLHKVEAGDHYQAARLKEAELLANSNRITEACSVLQNIRTEDLTQKSRFLRSCGSLLLEKGQKNEALEVFLDIVELTPKDSELLYQTALLAEQSGHMDKSENLFRRFIELNPDNPNGYNSLGYLWLTHGKITGECESFILKAMELSGGKDPYITDSMGWLRFKQGKLEEAVKHLKRAKDINPDDVEISLHLAEVLLVLSRIQEAEGILNSVLANVPKNAKALELMKRIDSHR